MKKVTMILLATALGAATLLAQRQFGPRGDGEGPRGARTPDALVELLSLDEGQVTALNENNKAFRQAVRTAMGENREKMQQFREAVENEDATLIGQLVLDRKNAHEQIGEIREQFQASALEILTDQQKATLADLQQRLDQLRELQPVAKQAAGLNLLDGQGDRSGVGFGRRGGGPGGPGGAFGRGGPRGGMFGGGGPDGAAMQGIFQGRRGR